MIDLLFIELGAVVTEVLGPTRCTIEPFCGLQPPTYDPQRRVELDFARSLDALLGDGAGVAQAAYDPFVCPADASGDPTGSPPIGPCWPGAAYEGVVRIREDLVTASPILAAAADAHPGRPYEYQVVASVDEQTRTVRRYHGFHAEILRTEGDVLVLRVAHAGGSSTPRWAPGEVVYDPAKTDTFYSGPLVADRLVGKHAGAVFIAIGDADGFAKDLPKLPPGAGL